MDIANVHWNQISESDDELAFSAVLDGVMNCITAFGHNADLGFVFALGDTFLQKFKHFFLCAAAQIISTTNNYALERIAGNFAEFTDVIVAAVARSV